MTATLPDPALPLTQRLKHALAVSPLAGPLTALRRRWADMRGWRHPELALLRREDAMIDAILADRIGADWTCLDVGTHLGSVAHKLRRLAPKGRLILVEASPAKAALLRKSFPQADLHAVAVTDTDGEVTFHENLAQPGFSSLANRDDRGATRAITVPARRLDDLLGDTRVHFVKIDVEGFEYPALRGAETLLTRDRPVILFEAGALDDASIDAEDADAMFGWLTGRMGYDVFAAFDLYYHRPPLTAERFASYRRYPFLAFNYFALPRDGSGPAT